MPLTSILVTIPRFDEDTFDLQVGPETFTIDRGRFREILRGRTED